LLLESKSKVVPVLNEAPCREDVWGSRGIAPRILNLSTRWRRVVSFTPRLLCPRRKSPWYPMDGRVGGPPEPVWTR